MIMGGSDPAKGGRGYAGYPPTPRQGGSDRFENRKEGGYPAYPPCPEGSGEPDVQDLLLLPGKGIHNLLHGHRQGL